jgi:branched-subunit amino acid aminotransferase/4-amino-4-deoxychorismate lyase
MESMRAIVLKQGRVYKKMLHSICQQAGISVFDRGFLYGHGVFTTIRVYNTFPFMFDKHIERLEQGCKFLKIKMPSYEEIFSAVKRVIYCYNKTVDKRIRITITAGKEDYLGPPFKANLVVYCSRINPTPPMSLWTSSWTRNPKDKLTGIKSLNYLPSMLSKIEAIENKKDEGLLLDIYGFISETSFANIFWLKNNTIFTPSEECGILKGVTRAIVLDISKSLGLNVQTGKFKIKDLLDSDEAFLTNSIREITQVVSLDDKKIGKGKVRYIEIIKKEYKKIVDLSASTWST